MGAVADDDGTDAVTPLLRSYDGHTDAVFALSWAPDDRAIASASRDGTVHIWSVTTCLPLLVFRAHATHVLAVSWSPDGQYIASGDTAGNIYIWHARTGQLHTHYQGHKRFVRSLSWSPDSQYIVSGGDYGDNTLQVWSAHTGTTEHILRSQYRIFSAPWSPDGQYIASGSFDGTIALLHVASGQQTIVGRYGPIYAIAWSPDSSHFVACGHEGRASIWYISTTATNSQQHNVRATLKANFGILTTQDGAQEIKTCAWSPDGPYIASGGNDTVLRIWSPYNGQEVASLQAIHQSWIRSVNWSSHGRYLASTSAKKIVLWDWREKNVALD